MISLRRKKQKIEYSGAKVQVKKETVHKKARNKPFFKKKTSKKPKIKKRRSMKINFVMIIGIFFGIGALAILSFGLYKSTLWIISSRAAIVEDIEETGDVLGFESVPVFPDSEYIFLPTDEPSSVKEFTSTGRSIYRLDWKVDIEDVYDFYEEELPNNGWEHALTVPRTSKTQMYGEYWINESGEDGIRIYNRVNDIWYEKISVEEAKTGLEEKLAQDIERELLISSGAGTEMLPDFPWSLTVPKEYLIKYFPTDEGDLRGAQFIKQGTELEYIFEPITQYSGAADDLYLEEYLSMINIRLEAGEENHRWEIISSKYKTIGNDLILEGTVTSSKGDGFIYILNNNSTNYSYAFFQPHGDDTFTKFFLKNISEKKSEHTGDDFIFTE